MEDSFHVVASADLHAVAVAYKQNILVAGNKAIGEIVSSSSSAESRCPQNNNNNNNGDQPKTLEGTTTTTDNGDENELDSFQKIECTQIVRCLAFVTPPMLVTSSQNTQKEVKGGRGADSTEVAKLLQLSNEGTSGTTISPLGSAPTTENKSKAVVPQPFLAAGGDGKCVMLYSLNSSRKLISTFGPHPKKIQLMAVIPSFQPTTRKKKNEVEGGKTMGEEKSLSTSCSGLAIGDKYGEIHILQIQWQDAQQFEKASIFALQHLSLLTALTSCQSLSTSTGFHCCTKLITSDKDGHIRVTRFPETFFLEGYLWLPAPPSSSSCTPAPPSSSSCTLEENTPKKPCVLGSRNKTVDAPSIATKLLVLPTSTASAHYVVVGTEAGQVIINYVQANVKDVPSSSSSEKNSVSPPWSETVHVFSFTNRVLDTMSTSKESVTSPKAEQAQSQEPASVVVPSKHPQDCGAVIGLCYLLRKDKSSTAEQGGLLIAHERSLTLKYIRWNLMSNVANKKACFGTNPVVTELVLSQASYCLALEPCTTNAHAYGFGMCETAVMVQRDGEVSTVFDEGHSTTESEEEDERKKLSNSTSSPTSHPHHHQSAGVKILPLDHSNLCHHIKQWNNNPSSAGGEDTKEGGEVIYPLHKIEITAFWKFTRTEQGGGGKTQNVNEDDDEDTEGENEEKALPQQHGVKRKRGEAESI